MYLNDDYYDTPERHSWAKKLKKYLYPSVDYSPSSVDYLPFFDFKKRSYHPDDVSSYYAN